MDSGTSFINLRQYSDKDMNALLKVAPRYLRTEIDIISACQVLRQQGMISSFQFGTLTRKLVKYENRGRFQALIFDVLQLVSFPEFIKLLHLINCKMFAEELETERYHRQMYFVEGIEVANKTRIIRYYTTMKSHCDNNVFLDRRATLLKFSRNLEQKMPRVENICDLQWLAERYTIIVQLCAKHYDDRDSVRATLETIRCNTPAGINTVFIDILYTCNLGMYFAEHGNVAESLDCIKHVRVLSSTCAQPFVRAFSHYHLQYIYRYIYSHNPSHENLTNALLHCQLGLNVLTDMDQSEIRLMRRVLLLNMIQTLLEIRTDFSINHNCPITDSNLHTAVELLKTVEENFSDIESRREMIYSLCKARTLQDCDPPTAAAYLDRALVTAEDGAYWKKNILNMTAYKNWLLIHELPCEC